MDDTDNAILFCMLKNPGNSLKNISEETGISQQDIYYRLKNIRSQGILKDYMIHLNPEIYGKRQMFAAFMSSKEYKGKVDIIIRCFESLTVYGISGNDDEINSQLNEMKSLLGNPVMEYSPRQPAENINLSKLDFDILDAIKKDPSLNTMALSKLLKKKTEKISGRLDFMTKNSIYSIIPRIDLSRTNIVITAFFSSAVADVLKAINEDLVIIKDPVSGIVLVFEENLEKARKVVSRVKEIDSGLDVMIVYDYIFYS